jgi:hypothetical protein
LRHESYSTTLPVLFLFLPQFTERIQFIKLLKLISIGVRAFAIAGIAIYPLISNKPVDEVKEKTEKTTSVLPPSDYTIIWGKRRIK